MPGTATGTLGFIDDVNKWAYATSTKEIVNSPERLYTWWKAWPCRLHPKIMNMIYSARNGEKGQKWAQLAIPMRGKRKQASEYLGSRLTRNFEIEGHIIEKIEGKWRHKNAYANKNRKN